MTTHLEPLGNAEWSGGGTTKPLGEYYECGDHTLCRGGTPRPPLPGDITTSEYLTPRPAGTNWFQVQVYKAGTTSGVYYNGCRVVAIPGQGNVGFCASPVYTPPDGVTFFVNDMATVIVDVPVTGGTWAFLQPEPGLGYVGYTGDTSTAGGVGPPETYFAYDPIGTNPDTGRPNFLLEAAGGGNPAGGVNWVFDTNLFCYAEVDDSDTTPPVGTVNFGLIRRGTFYGYEPTRR